MHQDSRTDITRNNDDGYTLFQHLTSSDLDWWFAQAREVDFDANATLLAEGDMPSALYFVIKGLFSVRVDALGGQALASIGPGALVGEMALLDGHPASATVVARETSTVAALTHQAIEARARQDPSFAARFYKALAGHLSGRLRRTYAFLESKADMPVDTQAGCEPWRAISASIDQLTEQLEAVDRQLMKSERLDPKQGEQLQAAFTAFAHCLWQQIGDQANIHEEMRQVLGRQVHRQLLPYLLLTDFAERMYSKPRGYAGDYFTIELMYQQKFGGQGRLGPVVDQCFMASPAARAVRNRRGLLAAEIGKTLDAFEGTVAITSLASGPAREVFDVLETHSEAKRLRVTCLDLDLQALAHVEDRQQKLGLKKAIRLVNENLIYLALGRKTLDIKPQRLVYSIGLIDYFEDALVIRLLNWVHRILAPGGRVILGNFHRCNTEKALMDHVLDWRLIHRDEADMDRLFQSSAFGTACSKIEFEQEGINMFATGIKADKSKT